MAPETPRFQEWSGPTADAWPHGDEKGCHDARHTAAGPAQRRRDRREAVKADLIEDLGADVSRQQETIIELAARTWIIVQALDDWLLRQPTLVAVRKRAVLPVVLQRQQLADSLSRMLERLGLERRAKRLPDLKTYLATAAADGAGSRDTKAGADASPPVSPDRPNDDGPEAEVEDGNP